MKDIAPEIFRQRLLIEGYYSIDVDEKVIESYLRNIALSLNLRIYADPIIYSPGGTGKEENQGYDAFVPLIDSGISCYIWSKAKFFSVLIYSCKNFDDAEAVRFTKNFYAAENLVYTSI